MPVYPRVAGSRAGIWPSWVVVDGICYLLCDNFVTAEGAPLVSPRVCQPGPGQLILDQTDGQFSIVAGEFTFPVQGTPAWGDQEWHALQTDGDEYDVLDQKKLILKFRGAWLTDDSPLSCWFGFSLDTTPDTVANAEHTFYRAVALGGGIRCTSGASDNALALRDLWDVNLGEYFQTAIVLRPYTAGGLHWYPEAAGVFAHGAHFFWRDEAGADSWRLAWYRQLQSRTDPLYPAFSNYDTAGKFDYVRIPCDEEDRWNPLFTPIVWDEFTDNNGVILPNHTITYGPGLVWVNALGTWQITGNQADPDNTGAAYCYVATLTPDVWIEVDAYLATANKDCGIIARRSENTVNGENYWDCQIKGDVAVDDTRIMEERNNVRTLRVTLDYDWALATWYNLRVRCDDEQVTFYVDHAEVAHYALGWFNKHATHHGLYAPAHDNSRFDNFIVLPRGTGLIRICYDSFTHINGTSLDATTTFEGAMAWIEDLGNWDIQGNEAHVNGSFSRAYVETPVSDIWCESRIELATNALPQGLIFRKGPDTPGGDNHWLYYIAPEIAGIDTWLMEIVEDAPTLRASADVDYIKKTYNVRVEADGQVITGYVDGTQHVQFNNAIFNQTAEWHGLYSHTADTNARWDQFRVTEIPALGEYDVALDSF